MLIECPCYYSAKIHIQTKCWNIFSSVPSELIHQIILHYTNTFQGLYHLRTINKEWKTIAESSMIWLHCSLYLHCPKNYLRPFSSHSEQVLKELFTSLKEQRYFSFHTKLDLYEKQDDDLLSHPYTAPCCSVKCDADNKRRQLLLRNSPLTSLQEESQKIFQWFHHLHRNYQQFWQKKIRILYQIYSLHEWFNEHFNTALNWGCLVALVLIFLSLYGWYTLDHNISNHIMSWENHFSFLCLYLVCCIHITFTVLSIIAQLCQRYCNTASLTISFWDYRHIFGKDSIILAFFCAIIFLLLIHVILSQKAQQCSYVLPWRITLIPVWICIVLSILCTSYGICRYPKITCVGEMIRLLVMISAALSITLFAIFYDQIWKVEYPAGYALLPLFPFLFLLILNLIIHVGVILGVLLDKEFDSHRKINTKIRLILNAGIIVSSCVALFTCVILCVDAFQGQSVIQSLSPIFQFAIFGFALHCWIVFEMILVDTKDP